MAALSASIGRRSGINQRSVQDDNPRGLHRSSAGAIKLLGIVTIDDVLWVASEKNSRRHAEDGGTQAPRITQKFRFKTVQGKRVMGSLGPFPREMLTPRR